MDGRLGPTSLSEVRRGLAGALRAEADEASLPRSGTARSPNAPIHRSSARRRSWKGVWIALVATVGFLALQVTVWHLSPLRTRPLDISVADTPASGETYYLAHDRGGHLDHHVLFHGLDDRAMERLRDAQVLFLGNSRMMFALDRQTLRGVLSRLGISYYVLGFGHDETAEFPMALIERHDIRPAVVVVNADNFFTGQPSAFANEVMGDSWFDAMKWRVEGIAAHSVRRALHHVIPHWPVLVLEEREFVIYRSALDGTWDVVTTFEDGGALPVARESADRVLDPKVIERARRFKDFLAERGAQLVLGLVPSPDFSRSHTRELADALGVPFVAPEVDNPRTIDGSHLTEESAEIFGRQFLDELAPILQQQVAQVR